MVSRLPCIYLPWLPRTSPSCLESRTSSRRCVTGIPIDKHGVFFFLGGGCFGGEQQERYTNDF